MSASNTNNVFVLAASETGELSRLETVNLAVTGRQPLGTTPSGMGLNSDGSRLLVACSDLNAAAIVDITGPRSRLEGFIPTGAYPTLAFGLPAGRMGVLNGKAPASALFVDIPDEPGLDALSRQVVENAAYRDEKPVDENEVTSGAVRAGGPIRHVLYIVKESLDPAKFGTATPNQDKLAKEFVRLNNFYVNSDGAGDGHNWATAAIASDYTQRMWPNGAGGRRRTYDYEGQEPANAPPAGYIWTAAGQAGISMRNYGYFVDNRAKPDTDGTQILKRPGSDTGA